MKNLTLIAVLFCAALASCTSQNADVATGLTRHPDTDSTCATGITTEFTVHNITITQEEAMDVYHESSEILYRSNNLVIYLDQSSADSVDQVHVYKIGPVASNTDNISKPAKANPATTQCTGTTKTGSRCKLRTSDPSGRCHLHR